jgi:hypothetical protein
VGEDRVTAGVVLFLGLLAAVVAYAPALSGGFVFDDRLLLEGYDCWHGLGRLPEILGLHGHSHCDYRPIRYLSFALDYSIGGGSPRTLHISNLIHHALTAALVFWLLRRWASAPAATIAAVVWALHPVHADAVAYISGRRDLLSTLLFVLAFAQLVPASGRWERMRPLVLGTGLYFAAFFTKEMAVTLPAVVLWALLLRPGHAEAEPLGPRLRRVLGGSVGRVLGWSTLGLAAVGFVLFRGVLASHSHMQGEWWGGSPGAHFATAAALIPRYLELIVFPMRLVGDYYFETIPLATGFSDPRSLLGVALAVGLVAAVVWSVRSGRRVVAFGLGWFGVTMLPVMQIFPHHELFAEHYLYLPTIGLAVAALPALDWLLGRPPVWRSAALVAIAVVALAATARTHVRSYDWEDELTFNYAVLQHAPRNLRAGYTAGVLLAERDECEAALPVLEHAIAGLAPEGLMGSEALRAYLQCSWRLQRREHVDDAIARFLEGRPDHPYGLFWRGVRYSEAGQHDRGVADLERAVALDPEQGLYQRALEVARQRRDEASYQ